MIFISATLDYHRHGVQPGPVLCFCQPIVTDTRSAGLGSVEGASAGTHSTGTCEAASNANTVPCGPGESLLRLTPATRMLGVYCAMAWAIASAGVPSLTIMRRGDSALEVRPNCSRRATPGLRMAETWADWRACTTKSVLLKTWASDLAVSAAALVASLDSIASITGPPGMGRNSPAFQSAATASTGQFDLRTSSSEIEPTAMGPAP